MARNRLWAKFTLEFADHPKIAGLSDAAFRMLVEMILWARAGETDGFIPEAVARRKWGVGLLTEAGTEAVSELVSNDEANPSLKIVAGGYQIHDFTDVQESKAEIQARTETYRENGRRGGRPKKTERVTERDSKAGTALPIETETETETYISSLLSRDDIRSVFDAFNDSLTTRGVKAKKPTKGALDAARLMLDSDGHSVDQITACIQWATSNEFWRTNILSLRTLRDKYDTLRMQAQRDRAETQPVKQPHIVYGFGPDDDD